MIARLRIFPPAVPFVVQAWVEDRWQDVGRHERPIDAEEQLVGVQRLARVRLLRRVGEIAVATTYERRGCMRCHNTRGGVIGNEQVVGAEVLCDYCHADYMRGPARG